MASHFLKPFKLFLKPSFSNLISRSSICTELSKLPGYYKMTSQTGLYEYYRAWDIPDKIADALVNECDHYLCLLEEDGIWTYKNTYFTQVNCNFLEKSSHRNCKKLNFRDFQLPERNTSSKLEKSLMIFSGRIIWVTHSSVLLASTSSHRRRLRRRR